MMLPIAKFAILIYIAAAVGCGFAGSSSQATDLREIAHGPAEPIAEPAKGEQTAVFAGGCFWGVEAVFEHVKGVKDVRSGYSGGDARSANYDDVSSGDTQHAESVIVKFDPAKVTYTQLLSVFFSVVHDPTEVNRQGPDTGPQYRSAIFYTDTAQKNAAEAYIAAINASKAFPKPVATQVVPLVKFYEAEEYHQDYLRLHPNEPYIVINDKPKIAALKEKFSDLYKQK